MNAYVRLFVLKLGDLMGILSDILEENRANVGIGGIDPVMVSPLLHYRRKSVHVKNYLKISEYASYLKKQEERRFLQQIFSLNNVELENAKNIYLVLEKIILEVINKNIVTTKLMCNLLNNLRRSINRSYRTVCELQYEYTKENHINIKKYKNADEDNLRTELLSNIIDNVLLNMKHDEKDNSEEYVFRKIVKDCASIIIYIEKIDSDKPLKTIFSKYLEDKGISKTKLTCRNCGDSLYEGIDYCLTCYERDV